MVTKKKSIAKARQSITARRRLITTVHPLTIMAAARIGVVDGAGVRAGTGTGKRVEASIGAGLRLASARDAVDEIFQISDAGPVAVKPALVCCNFLLERRPPCGIASQTRRRRDK